MIKMNTEMELGLSQNVGSELMPDVVNGKVDARSVHEALEINERFTQWFQRRATEFGFREGEDFFPNFGSKTSGSGGHNRADYDITLDMAKELAMVERNEMGRKMRRYFIDCEKRLVSPPAAAISPPPGLNKLETALVDLAREHDGRIAKLETLMRPGPDWESPYVWWHRQPTWAVISAGRLARLSAVCTQKSAVLGLPIGKEFYRLPGGKMKDRRSFAPAVLEAVCPRRLDTWAKKDGVTPNPPASSQA